MPTKFSKLFSAVAVISLAMTPAARADVKLANVFNDHMVLQQDMPVPIWGTADPGEQVTVNIADQQAQAVAGTDGKWTVRLKALKAGGPLKMTVTGKNTLKIADILVGEVWVASGQSNMEFPVAAASQPKKEVAQANYPKLRMYTVKKTTADEPQCEVAGQWEVCCPDTVARFSAVGYYFARELHQQLDIPIGILHTSWGGTAAQSWTCKATLEADPDLKELVADSSQIKTSYQQKLKKYKEAITAWIDESIASVEKDQPVTPAPNPPSDPRFSPHRSSVLYNAMISPLIPYAIRGVIWYQGESNAGRAYQYRKLFPAMIQNWRKDWGQGDFPFLFVQLANFKTKAPVDGMWAELREAQTMTLSLKNTGMAVAADIGDALDIHPKNKQDVGRRLALAAQAQVYGRQIAYSGPMYESLSVKGKRARISFRFAEGLKTSDGEAPQGFVIAGEDQQFVEANARIRGDKVVVWAESVAKPVAVRYGWSDNPTCTLYNGAGLPASPFRTDDWPGLTINAK